MKSLSRVLLLKIGITIAFWFLPLLFCPIRVLHDCLGFPDLGPAAIFIRLLGMAYGSLLVAYGFGLIEARQGRYPRSTVWTGIVSNGGAFLLLAIGAWQHAWETWEGWAPGFMWASLVATGLITTGLIAFGPCGRDKRMRSRGTVEQIVDLYWLGAGERQRVRELLATYGRESYEPEHDRVRLAVLKLSGGDIEKVSELVSAAKEDYRDILMWAESPEQAKVPWPTKPLSREDAKRFKELRARDRKQYDSWLKSPK